MPPAPHRRISDRAARQLQQQEAKRRQQQSRPQRHDTAYAAPCIRKQHWDLQHRPTRCVSHQLIIPWAPASQQPFESFATLCIIRNEARMLCPAHMTRVFTEIKPQFFTQFAI